MIIVAHVTFISSSHKLVDLWLVPFLTRHDAKPKSDTFVSKHTVGSNGCVRKLDDGRMDGGGVKL